MRLQVLVSTMHQNDYSLLERMNIQSDAIVVNQCDENKIETFDYKGHTIKWISLNERGVGLSRNTTFMRADADIVLFADDDVVYDEGYADKVIRAFEESRASIVTFNFVSLNPQRPEHIDERNHKIHRFNCLKYGAFRIAARLSDLRRVNVVYSLLFGGGARYQAGEDNLFMTNCLQNSLKCVANNQKLGSVKQEESTWFKGYNEKYYFDRGALFAAMYKKWAIPMLLLFELKNSKRKEDISFKDRFMLEKQGVKAYRRGECYNGR